MKRSKPSPDGPRTLCIDVGGTGIKAMVVSSSGKALTERTKVDTPRPATKKAVEAALRTIVPAHSSYDRITIRVSWRRR